MTIQQLSQCAQVFTETAEENRVPREKAMEPQLAGMKIFDPPLLGAVDATDPYLAALRDGEAMAEQFMPPLQWMPGAKTIISFFSPYTEAVRRSNRKDPRWPSKEWLHGRVEGQAFIAALTRHMQSVLEEEGFAVVAPSLDPRFESGPRAQATDMPGQSLFASNWSERHVAYACGIGTFSLSKGLITEKGIAGRIGSLLTDLVVDQTGDRSQEYAGNCTRCGACVAACPAGAITLEHGKSDKLCDAFLDTIRKREAPYYGCGKCQTGVPCETRNPSRPVHSGSV